MTACFKCGLCGECCGGFAKPLKDSVSEFAGGIGPLYYLTKPKDVRPPLFVWEAERLSRLEPRFSYTPRSFVYDLNSKKALVFDYNLNHDDCVFLGEDSKCGVYSERPLVCRSFPLAGSGLGRQTLKFSRCVCPQAVDVSLPKAMTNREYIEVMLEAYGDVFLWAVVRDAARGWIKSKTVEAEDDGLVELLCGVDDNRALMMACKSRQVDLIEHLSKTKGGFKREFDRKLEDFSRLDYARNLVDENL